MFLARYDDARCGQFGLGALADGEEIASEGQQRAGQLVHQDLQEHVYLRSGVVHVGAPTEAHVCDRLGFSANRKRHLDEITLRCVALDDVPIARLPAGVSGSQHLDAGYRRFGREAPENVQRIDLARGLGQRND